jgi:hypothetical protein
VLRSLSGCQAIDTRRVSTLSGDVPRGSRQVELRLVREGGQAEAGKKGGREKQRSETSTLEQCGTWIYFIPVSLNGCVFIHYSYSGLAVVVALEFQIQTGTRVDLHCHVLGHQVTETDKRGKTGGARAKREGRIYRTRVGLGCSNVSWQPS